MLRKRIEQSIIAPFVAIFALGLVAIRPLFNGRLLACSDDITFHILRMAQYDALFKQGVLFSRWAPDMALGYGYPLFNFYAPLSYYFAQGFSFLVGGDLNLGLRLTFAFGVIAGGFTIYLLAREFFSQSAALIAAVAYMYAPYQGYDIYFRGNLAESFAWWLMPLSLWCVVKLIKSRSWWWVAPAAIIFAAVILSHNAFALLFSPLLLAFGLWLLAFGYQALAISSSQNGSLPVTSNHQPLTTGYWQLTTAISLGLALSAFFWLPALIERQFVYTDRLLVPPTFVYWGNFLSLGELLTPPVTIHPDLINPSIPRALGWPMVALALISLVGMIFGRLTRIQRTISFFFVGATVVTAFLTLPASELIWETAPLLEFVQFPWRFLGVTALTLAMASAAGLDTILPSNQQNRSERGTMNLWVTLAVSTIIVCSALFWFTPRYCEGNDSPTVADILSLESWSNTIGTTAKGEYVPRTVKSMPDEPYAEPFTVPAGVGLSDTSRTPLTFSTSVQTSSPVTLTANVFYYPGWKAELNGELVEITPTVDSGLISIDVPAGEHDVDIWFGETPLRRSANIASGLTLLITLALFATSRSNLPSSKSTSKTMTGLIPIFVFGILLFGFVGWVFPRFDSFLIRPRLSEVASENYQTTFQGGLALVDYQLEARSMPTDGTLDVLAELTTITPASVDTLSAVRLIDSEGRNWLTPDVIHPRIYRNYYETRLWNLDQYAEDLLIIDPVPGTPPGLYTAEFVAFNRTTFQPIPLSNGQETFPLGQIELVQPSRPEMELDPQQEANHDFGAVSLVGFNLDRFQARPGDPFGLTVFWEANQTIETDLKSTLKLVADQSYFEQIFPLVRDDWSTTEWEIGDRWRGQQTFFLPADLPTNSYTWQLCIDDSCVELGELEIDAPDRLFEQPPLDVSIDQTYPSLAILTGAQLADDFSAVSLVWNPVGETNERYRVFVHLLNQNGELVAQSDSEPASWSRPTTSWLPGEYVLDSHALQLPDPLPVGEYRILVGLYTPNNGQRLLTENQQDTILVTEFSIR